MFRLIENRKAKNPYYHELTAVHIYSIEELCFFMENNMYLLDEDWAGESLFSWLEVELHYTELARQLRQLFRKTKNIFACAELIFQMSHIYSDIDLFRISGLLKKMDGKNSMERRKMRGDLFLESGKLRQAAYIYMELLEPEYQRQMTEELRGNILHNLGVVYARLFLFTEAAYMFSQAYKFTKSDQTRQQYLFALNYADNENSMTEKEMNLNFSVMKDALYHLTEVSDQQEYYVERKKSSLAASAFDWKSKQTELIQEWNEDYKRFMS